MKLLHIDDDAIMREIVASTLARYLPDLSLQSADSLTTATDTLKNYQPDIVILDQTLPDGKGLDWLARHPTLKSIKIILMSGHDMKDEINTMHGWQITMLLKPVRPKQLVAVLQAVISARAIV